MTLPHSLIVVPRGSMDAESGLAVVAEAAQINGLQPAPVEVIRRGSHLICRLRGGVVARVGEPGTEPGARREIAVSRWLSHAGIPVVRLYDGPVQPTVIASHPVTWWEELPSHRYATPAELGAVLRALHRIPPPPPELDLPAFDPIDGRVHAVFAETPALSASEREWIEARVEHLAGEIAQADFGQPMRVIHGDAWQGNVAVADGGGPVLLDLEAVCVGPIEWDLIPFAVDYTDFARVPCSQYEEFVRAYGYDVTHSSHYRLLGDIQELRWTSFVARQAAHSLAAAKETSHRLACLAGVVPRPWTWTAF